MIQSEIVSTVNRMVEHVSGSPGIGGLRLQFHSELPELTMDFNPEILLLTMVGVLAQVHQPESLDREISITLEQFYPSSLSIIMAIPSLQGLDIEAYRELVQRMNSDIHIGLGDNSTQNQLVTIEIPISNLAPYFTTEQIAELLQFR